MTTPAQAAAPGNKTGGAGGGKAQPQKAAPQPRSFLAGTQKIYQGGDYDNSVTGSTAGAQDMPPWQIQPTGFLAEDWLLVEGLTSANAATVSFAQNGAFGAINSMELDDVNSEPIFGPFDGWTAACITNKFGAYGFSADPRASNMFYQTTGSGGTGGSFRFGVRIPLEIVARDALGAVPSESNTASLTVRINISATAAAGNLYTVAPTTPPVIRVRSLQRAYWPPKQVDQKTGRPFQQAPPLVNTTQYWSRGSQTVNTGTINQTLIGAWLGYPIRNYVLELVDATGSRVNGDANFPDPFTLKYEGNLLVNALPKKLWERQMGEDYGYQASSGTGPNPATKDVAGGLENGVYVVPFNKDFGLQPGAETRRTYLPTRSGSTVAAIGSVGGSGSQTMFSVVNYVAAAGGNTAGLSMGR
jgi:hypothetical protein